MVLCCFFIVRWILFFLFIRLTNSWYFNLGTIVWSGFTTPRIGIPVLITSFTRKLYFEQAIRGCSVQLQWIALLGIAISRCSRNRLQWCRPMYLSWKCLIKSECCIHICGNMTTLLVISDNYVGRHHMAFLIKTSCWNDTTLLLIV